MLNCISQDLENLRKLRFLNASFQGRMLECKLIIFWRTHRKSSIFGGIIITASGHIASLSICPQTSTLKGIKIARILKL